MLRERDFQAIIEVIQRSERIKLRAETGFSQKSFTLRTPFSGVVLQFKVVDDEHLVIQRMSFTKQRSGLGTTVLNELKAYAVQQQLPAIIIEDVNTIAMYEFARKHGFETVTGSVYIQPDGRLYGTYRLVLRGAED